MQSDTVPASLLSWFNAKYSLSFSADWVHACVQYIREQHDAISTPQLIQKVNYELLHSDLATSVDPTSSLLPLELAQSPKQLLFANERNRAVLVQIISLTDISHSALSLLEISKERLERDGGDAATVSYPRGMLKFEVSDGHRRATAIEWATVPGLSLETSLGTKLLLKNVQSRRGLLFLSPDKVTVLGGKVEEIAAIGAEDFVAGLQSRLGLPPVVPREQPEDQRMNDPSPPTPPPANREPPQRAQQPARARPRTNQVILIDD